MVSSRWPAQVNRLDQTTDGAGPVQSISPQLFRKLAARRIHARCRASSGESVSFARRVLAQVPIVLQPEQYAFAEDPGTIVKNSQSMRYEPNSN